MKLTFNPFATSLIAALVSSTLPLHAITWDGNGTNDASGDWSLGDNWDTNVVPGAADTAVLTDVTSSTRTVTFNTAATSPVLQVDFNQATTGATNLLDIQKSLTVTNAITLGAAAGTERISIGSTAAATFVLTPTGGITLDPGGELLMTATGNGVSSYFFGNIGGSGTTTIQGGTLTMAPTTGTGGTSASNTHAGSLTMTSGSLIIDNITGQQDRRLQIQGVVNISGGTVSITKAAAAGNLTFASGSPVVFNPDSFTTNLNMSLDRAGAQSLSTNKTLGNMQFRGTGVKILTSSASGTGIGQIQIFDANGTGGSQTTLKLGSNFTSNANAAMPAAQSFGNTHESGRIDLGIDTNGFTLDLTAGASSGAWTPNLSTQSGVTNTVWNLSGSGVIKANRFNFNTSGVTTNVAANTVLTAGGGNNTATDLGGTGTIDAASTFRYSGTAAIATPATLTSNRSIGKLDVTSGALSFGGSGSAAGAASVSGGARLILNYTADTGKLADAQSLTLGTSTIELSGGTHEEIVGSTTLNGSVTLTRSSGSAILNLGTITQNPGSGLAVSAGGIAKTTNSNDGTGLLGLGWLTVGGALATNNAGTIDAFTGFTSVDRLGGTIVNGSSTNIGINNGGGGGNITLGSATTTVNTLSMIATDGPATVDISGPGTLNLASGYLFMNSSSGVLTLGTAANEGFLTAGGPLDTAGTLTVSQGSANTFTINSVIADNGTGVVSLNHTGTGTTMLAGTNTFTGKTTVFGGKLSIASESPLGPAPAAPTADQLTLNGGTLLTTASFAIDDANRGITLGASGGTIEVDSGTTLTVAATNTISGGALTKAGSGQLTLAGSHSHTGLTTVTAGVLRVSNSGALGGTAGGTVVNASVNTTLGTTLDLNGVSMGSGESLTMASGNLTGDSRATLRTVGTTTNTWAGGVLLTGIRTVQIQATTGGQLEISGLVTHSSFTGAVTLRGGGTGTLSGGVSLSSSTVVSVNEATSVWNINTSGNTWGNTNVFRGTLVLGANGALPTTTSLNLGGTDGSGTLKLNGRSQTVAGLTTNVTTTTNKVVNGSATAGALTVNNSTANAFAGVLGGTGTDENLFSLTKSGSSTLTLSGTNTYSGDTTVGQGTLTLNNPNANNELSTVNIAASGATLTLNFDETGGPATDTVRKLFIGGVQQDLGVYKAADNVTDSGTPIAQITGPGTLTVTTGPGGLSPYDDWADDFPGFTPTTATLDFDNDGIDNLLEFVLGGNPTLSEPGIAPAVNASGSDLVVTFKRSDASELQPVTVKVQVSDDLSTWNPANDIIIGAVGVPTPIPPTNATYTVAENAAAADTIVVTIPKAAVTRKFARVVANN